MRVLRGCKLRVVVAHHVGFVEPVAAREKLPLILVLAISLESIFCALDKPQGRDLRPGQVSSALKYECVDELGRLGSKQGEAF